MPFSDPRCLEIMFYRPACMRWTGEDPESGRLSPTIISKLYGYDCNCMGRSVSLLNCMPVAPRQDLQNQALPFGLIILKRPWKRACVIICGLFHYFKTAHARDIISKTGRMGSWNRRRETVIRYRSMCYRPQRPTATESQGHE